MAGIEIVVVEGRSELGDFIDFPWKIYAQYPKWVPPLKKEVRRLLDPRRHPFWASAERRLFLARRGSETVGRIAAIIDRRYNELHDEKMGIWGFFECIDDPVAAAALFSAVETWAHEKGMAFVRGPLNPSTNYEVGLLIEGFDHPPAVMMTYNPPYYPKLAESCGFTKEKDLVAFLIDGDYRLPEWMDSLAARIAQKKGVSIRRFRPKDQNAEFALVKEIYNASWSGNWGFVPLSDDEMRDIQKSVMTFADPDLAFFIYYEADPAAVCVIFPDINPLLKRLNGRIGLLGLLKAILYRREITGLRCLMFGIKDKYRQMGLPLLAVRHIYEVVRKKGKYRSVELGWTLEDNEDVNALLEEAGARRYKKYRIFRKPL
ncbi:MAG: acyl-CoA N-acyltransferase [Lentisphaerae bacterium RIFOXYB12_FULL_65_16]|nr:MAG: acyl-CoA N-acyltransferase [Lentisphaerae bacterium RIFOXYA12_64_32]OGV92247.1 MAG: acyl-CoA N-acyltransferase [Lentisphaerae bacterium RIFOXYB12_FULL_65_16]